MFTDLEDLHDVGVLHASDGLGLDAEALDDAYTAPLHGFSGADDYYARSSSLPFLSRITVPTLCISALDDPFLPAEATRRARDAASSAVRFVVTERGGHAGFVAARGLTPVYWAEELVIRFLLAAAAPAGPAA